jgi:hypothetical protein
MRGMTVADLLAELQDALASGRVGPASIVVLQADPEGNNFWSVDHVGTGTVGDGPETGILLVPLERVIL